MIISTYCIFILSSVSLNKVSDASQMNMLLKRTFRKGKGAGCLECLQWAGGVRCLQCIIVETKIETSPAKYIDLYCPSGF